MDFRTLKRERDDLQPMDYYVPGAHDGLYQYPPWHHHYNYPYDRHWHHHSPPVYSNISFHHSSMSQSASYHQESQQLPTPPEEPIVKRPKTEQKDKPKKRTRAPKDKNAPKHPMSAFLFYLAKVRPQYTEKYPGSPVGPISKLISAAWKQLTDEERQPFIDMSQKDKDRYARELREYYSKPVAASK
ncbi:high mobility group box domain-containing protein [Gorgonomyces haynaldii]|nr:high mobility group box domain-containing protein [Gorgonomyces haynaldii]